MRYFIVVFQLNSKDRSGWMNLNIQHEKYPNNNWVLNHAATRVECEPRDLCIVNIMELTEEDFLSYTSQECCE
jgi:hypothetical protein